jgi:organic radical activating enzyme
MKKTYQDLNLKTHSDGKVWQNDENLHSVISGLNSVSSSLCLAKFTQVTLHLGSGLVHSCHHPKAHKIPLEEIEENPAALFNTTLLKAARKEMLNNARPAECDYCWRVENNKGTSDRFYKSSEDWAIKEYDNVVNSTGDEIFNPTYLEVSFGNACNLKCVYCGPEFSSKWVEELKTKGPVIISDGHNKTQWAQGWQDLDNISIPNREHNPYIEAFWKWFPTIYPSLKHYRITGGEPLLNKNTIRSLDYLIQNPKKELELSINTNLSVPEKVWKDFLNKVIELENSANFKKITIFTSLESWEEKAEYARSDLEFKLLKNRFEELLEKTSVRCVVMATYNILSVTSFKQVLEWILKLKKQYNYNFNRNSIFNDTGIDVRTNRSVQNKNSFRVGIDIPYLRHPRYLDAQYCDNDLLIKHMIPCLDYMIANSSENKYQIHLGFEKYEVEKFQRIVENRLYFKEMQEVVDLNRAKFFDFVNQIDSRRNQSFLRTFPEMEQYYNQCENLRNQIQ